MGQDAGPGTWWACSGFKIAAVYPLVIICFVICEKGTLLWNGISGKVDFFAKGDNGWSTLFSSKADRSYTYTEEIKSFFSSIESNKLPCISGVDGAYSVAVVEAIKKSSKIETVVYL